MPNTRSPAVSSGSAVLTISARTPRATSILASPPDSVFIRGEASRMYSMVGCAPRPRRSRMTKKAAVAAATHKHAPMMAMPTMTRGAFRLLGGAGASVMFSPSSIQVRVYPPFR